MKTNLIRDFGFKHPIDNKITYGVEKMAKEQEKTKEFVPTPPVFQGSGVSVWINKDKNGNEYLSVSVLGGKSVNCFKYKPKDVNE